MKKKYILDAIILLLVIVCAVSIFNSVKADTDTNEIAVNNVEDSAQENIETNETTENIPNIITTSGKLGDVDGNGDVNSNDASQILSFCSYMVVYYKEPTADQLSIADLDEDGKISATDASYILEYSAAKGASYDITLEQYLADALKQ